MNKQWYIVEAQKQYKLYQKALDAGDKKAADAHMKEFLNYEKASK